MRARWLSAVKAVAKLATELPAAEPVEVAPCFGERAFVHQTVNGATISCVADGELWVLDRRGFEAALKLGRTSQVFPRHSHRGVASGRRAPTCTDHSRVPAGVSSAPERGRGHAFARAPAG